MKLPIYYFVSHVAKLELEVGSFLFLHPLLQYTLTLLNLEK